METGACVSMAVRGMARLPLVSPAQSHTMSQLPLSFVPSRNNKAFITAALSPGTIDFRAPLVSTSSPPSFKQLIEGLIGGVDLTEEEAEASVDLLLEEQNEALISAFLVLLRAKGETFQEIVGLARAMFKRCRQVQGLEGVVDIVGTGGDGADTVNISTGTVVHSIGAIQTKGRFLAKLNFFKEINLGTDQIYRPREVGTWECQIEHLQGNQPGN